MVKKKNDTDEYLPYVYILDLDDTLYKEIDFVHSAFCHIDRLLVADYGFPAGEARRIMLEALMSDKNSFDALDTKLKEAGINIPNAISWMVDEYRYHIPQIYLSDEAYGFISELDELDIEMYIITDGRSVTQRNKIRALGLDEFIPPENVFISEEVGEEKINGTSFSKIMKRFEDVGLLEEIRFVFVGDNPSKDFIIGNTFNYPTVMLLDDGSNIHRQDMRVPRSFRPQFEVEKLTDVITLMESGAFS